MSNASNKFLNHTHYGVSTAAAVVYAIVWLLSNQVHAEVGVEAHVLPAVIVTAPRAIATKAMLDPVVVNGHRVQSELRYAMLPPVIVSASRDVARGSTLQPTVLTSSLPEMSAAGVKNVTRATRAKSVIANVRNWFASALIR